ncbi:MAG: ATP-binding protein, partial [Polyangiales bacterium]
TNEMLLRAASDGIHVLDAKGNVVQANDAFCRMLGYSLEEILKLNVSQWDARWSERELREELIPKILTDRRVFETRHRRRDGEIIDVEVSAAGVDLGGESVIFASSRDITQRKQTEENLRRVAAELVETNRLKDVFTDVLRHDLLTPINAIAISTQLLLDAETDPRKIEILERLKRSTRNLVEMTENAAKLESVVSLRAPEFVVADPVQLLRSVLSDFGYALEEKHLTLTDRSDERFVASFHPAIREVFLNLVSNAIKYSPAGARIEVGVEEHEESWRIVVKDQGVGVPELHKQKIFNRFERLEKQGVRGSGLGLTIAKQIVDLHGGKVWVEDNPSGGSVFMVQLPKTPTATPD